MSQRQQLAHALKLQFGLRFSGLTDAELDAIIADVAPSFRQRQPTREEWRTSVSRHVPDAGMYSYGGEDMSDINMLLLQILNQGGSAGPQSTR